MKKDISHAMLLVILFLVGFMSDLVVQQVGKHVYQVGLFEPFWQKYGPIGAAAIAGGITVLVGGIFLLISGMIYRYYDLEMKSWSFVLFSTALAYVLGTILDVWTNRGNWIPSLRKWYDGMGEENASIWSGGLPFAFAVFVATTLAKLK